MNQIVSTPKRSLVDSMAAKYEMEPAAFMGAVKATCIKGECSNEQFAAFLMVAKEYDLNPLTKEIYAFPDRGGITPIVSIDGWMNLINSHPQFDGMEFADTMGDDGKLHSVECKMYRKDRQRPTTVIEYMSECFRQTDPWKKWPNRMLRHKAAIQCARYAFGFSGIMEPDEYERMKDITPAAQPSVMDRLKQAREATQQPQDAHEGFSRSFDRADIETPLTGEIMEDDTNSDASPTSEEPEASPSATGEAGDAVPSSPASYQLTRTDASDLRDCANEMFGITVMPHSSPEERRAVLEASKDEWKGKLPAVLHPHLKSIFTSADAVIKGKADRNEAIETLAGMLGCEPGDIGGANG